MCISETFLNDNKDIIGFSDFNHIRGDRDLILTNKDKGGGVLILTKKSLMSCEYKLMCSEIIRESSNIEIVAGRVKDRHMKAIIVCCVYRPPNYRNEFLKNDIVAIDMIVTELINTNRPFILCGDFNLKHASSYQKLVEVMKKHKLSQLISSPTRGNAVLDLIITNHPELCTSTTVHDPMISDHKQITTTLIFQRKQREKKTFTYRNYNNININSFHEDIYNAQIDTTNENHAQCIYNELHSLTMNIFNKHAPTLQKTITVRERPLKLSENTKQLLRIRDSFDKQDLHNPEYIALKKAVKRGIIGDKKSEVDTAILSDGMWPTVNKLLNNKNTNQGEFPFTVDEINEHFTKICCNEQTNKEHAPTYQQWTNNYSHETEKFRLEEISYVTVKFAWRSMKKKLNSSEDANGISNRMIDMLIKNDVAITLITSLFNASVRDKFVPPELKRARIVAVPKTTKIASLNDFRPISILPVLSKLLEKCVYLQLIKYITSNKILSDSQFGFRPKHATFSCRLK
ncbi:RNA-directed DNA polymerase from mobile element jockey [Orchesella cincta]|uniref:RNA-directed DNA polymerase from mobile element jockey n=1 Tax=Orchesella cincta TaxID=48709 RepID=A0A1D2MEN6_ORCCI|nr:RNA-directed DNA polymerase from mobile element jockey [Orchesella cincta]